MSADLRTLAERLGLLKPCEVCANPKRGSTGYLIVTAPDGRPMDVQCPAKCLAGRRTPTEAEVRAAIFKAGWRFVEAFQANGASAFVRFGRSTRADGDSFALPDEASPDDLVLLALLRAFEEVRRGD